MAAELGGGLVNPDFIARMLQTCGLDIVAEYFQAHGFGAKFNTRVADFGEVVAGAMLEQHEEFVQPIRKLRYRETSHWAMRLTDVFGVKLVDGAIALTCFTSVKTRSGRPPQDVRRL